MKPILPLVSGLAILSSCAFFQPTDKTQEQFIHYIDAKDFSAAQLEEIAESLSRKTSMGGGIYRLTFTPYTDAYLQAYINSEAELKSLSEKDAKKLKETLHERYLNGKSCFRFDYEIAKIDRVTNPESWKLTAISPLGEDSDPLKYKLSALPPLTGTEYPKAKSFTYIGSIREPVWFSHADFCTAYNDKINFHRDFALDIQVSYVPFPFDRDSEVTWHYPVYEIVNGEKVEVKEKKKSFKGYRGW